MAETVVENLVCESCGVGVREASTFCYNCGEPISQELNDSGSIENDALNDARHDEEFSEDGKEDDKVAASEVENAGVKESSDGVSWVNSFPGTQTRLETAASLRNKAKAFDKKPIEVVWEEPAKPSRLFVFVSIVLTLFAAAILFLALYLK